MPRRRGGMWAGILAALVLLGAGGYLAAFKRDAVRGLFAHKDARAEEAYRQGREYFLLDSDDAFRNAAAAFERAHQADDKSALPLAGLADVMTTWASYLRDDAKGLEAGTPSVTEAAAAKTLRRDSQEHLDDAKKYASDALAHRPRSARGEPRDGRLSARRRRAGGRGRALSRRARRPKRRAMPEAAFVAGALAFRDGNLDGAKSKLTQANTLNQAATQHALLRASVLLARIALSTGDKAGAKSLLQTVLTANTNHDRARALLATFDSGTTPAAPRRRRRRRRSRLPMPPPAPSGAAEKPATRPEEGNDYGKLIALGDRMSENGHAKEARKLYERALALKPDGLEAIMGLGYCDLDGEKFSSAVDHFKRALSMSPSYGDAIIGLAEAYKLRGDHHEALNWYANISSRSRPGPRRRWPRTTFAISSRKWRRRPRRPRLTSRRPNRRDLPEEIKKTDEPKKADDDKPVQLPRPPTSDEPPP